MFGWIGKIILILLFGLTIKAFLKHAIRKIIFFDDGVRIHFYFGKESLINFSDILSLQEIQQGIFIFSLVVIRTKAKINGKQKFPFYCPQNLKMDFYNFLNEKKLKKILNN